MAEQITKRYKIRKAIKGVDGDGEFHCLLEVFDLGEDDTGQLTKLTFYGQTARGVANMARPGRVLIATYEVVSTKFKPGIGTKERFDHLPESVNSLEHSLKIMSLDMEVQREEFEEGIEIRETPKLLDVPDPS